MRKIGFSTGCLCKSDMQFNDRIKLYSSVGASAIELCFASPRELLDFELSGEVLLGIREYKFVSIHAPWRDIRYCSDTSTNRVVERLEDFCEQWPIEGIVLHPDTIDDFSDLERANLPFLLENMDPRKQFGALPGHFIELKKKCNFGFVFDALHAYKNDPSMRLSTELLSVMGERLRHMHVSGSDGCQGHTPLYLSDNQQAIAEVLKSKAEIPVILEGVIMKDIPETLYEELSFVGRL